MKAGMVKTGESTRRKVWLVGKELPQMQQKVWNGIVTANLQ
jgi:hypothetical protein